MSTVPLFKRAVTMDKLNASFAAQSAELPDCGLEMTSAEMCERIRGFLWRQELERINGTKNLPLYPMVWEVRDIVSVLGLCTTMGMDSGAGSMSYAPAMTKSGCVLKY